MHPTLISFGPIQISSLGFFLFFAFFAATFIIWKKAKEKLYPEETVFDSIFLVTIAGLMGARLSYILLNWPNFGFNLLKWLLINGYPGLYFYGGEVAGIAVLYWYYKNKATSFWEMFDYFTQGFWLAFIVGEVGVFLDGGEVGKVINLPWAVSLLNQEGLRHPIALYKILLLGGVFLGLIKLLGDRQALSTGRFGLLFLAFLGLANFLVDFLKEFSVYYWWLALDQWVSGGIVLMSGILLYKHVGMNLKGDILMMVKKLKVKKKKV